MLQSIFGAGASQGTFLSRLIAMDSEDALLMQQVCVELVNTLKTTEAAKFASVVLLKRYEHVKKLESVYQRGKNTHSFAYHLAKAVFDNIGYPVKSEERMMMLDMIETMLVEEEAYEVKGPLDSTIVGKKLKELFNREIPNLALLILFPLYRSLKQTQNVDDAKALFRKLFFENIFRDALLTSEEKGHLTKEQKLTLIDKLKPDDVFSSLTTKLDKCKLDKPVEISEESIKLAQRIFEKHQRKAKINREITPLKDRVKELTGIFTKCDNVRYHAAAEEINRLGRELLEALNRDITTTQEQDNAKLEQYNQEVSKVVLAIINEPIDGLTLMHRLVMLPFSRGSEAQLEKQKLQRELECLLEEGADLELTTTNYAAGFKGLIGSVLMVKKAPFTVSQLAKHYGNHGVLSQALEAFKPEEEAPPEILEADPTLGWQRGVKRSQGQRTPPTTPPVTPRGTKNEEEDKTKKLKKG